jgi:hypothetical protein
MPMSAASSTRASCPPRTRCAPKSCSTTLITPIPNPRAGTSLWRCIPKSPPPPGIPRPACSWSASRAISQRSAQRPIWSFSSTSLGPWRRPRRSGCSPGPRPFRPPTARRHPGAAGGAGPAHPRPGAGGYRPPQPRRLPLPWRPRWLAIPLSAVAGLLLALDTLQVIRQLLLQGDREAAIERLTAFRRAHPHYPLPADLASLANTE